MSVKLHVEGGGDSKALKTACRRGFSLFFRKAGLAGLMPRIVACGGRQNAFERFATSMAADANTPLLLVDSEGPIAATDAWAHLAERDHWARPAGATDDQCHLLVQVMESWFLADAPALASYYGQGFQANALPGNQQVEVIPKADVLDGLGRATRNTQKGTYDKGSHSFDLLACLDPGAVEDAAPHAQRLLDKLRAGG